MIQEPQQQEIIEIPLTNSMSSAENSVNRNKLSNNPKIQNNNKSQRTEVQIPQLKTKPRIFLLTRPSKPQLVRLENPTVQPHHQRNLNISQIHRHQKTTSDIPVTVASQRQTGTIRIPFLPRSQVQTFSVKSKQFKQAINHIPYQNQREVKQFADHTLPQNLIIQQVIQLSPSSVETSNNQFQIHQNSDKNTITKRSVNLLSASENENTVIESQSQARSNTPLTLASMAGIELTGADVSLSQVDMSGAMPPTATVEEINVPVFIDECLKEASTSTTPVTTNTTFNINNNCNSNINISKNFSNSDHGNEIGNEVNNFLDTVDNFEFDINLLTTENSGKDKKTSLEVKGNQPLTDVDGDENRKQHQLELQIMLDKILFDTNTTTSNNYTNFNNNNNNNYNNNNNNNNNNNGNNSNTSNTNNGNTNNYNIINMAGNIDLTDDLFKVAPYTELNDFLSPDDIESSGFGTTQFNSEEAVDLNSISKDFSLDECFINSQPTEIMFSCGYPQSQSSSQNLINEISKAEPHIAIATTSEAAAVFHMDECDLNNELDNFYTSRYMDENSTADCKETKPLVGNHLKRHSTPATSHHMLQKRLKLRLDTKQCRENVLPQQSEISTPKVIDFIDQFNDVIMGTAVDSIKTIYNDLISSSPKCVSVKSEIFADDTNDFSPPNTPCSVNSISNQTSFINTAPSSPASSIATTSNASIATKRGRGRPAKAHSDIPDRSQIQHLSESDQKKVLERAKNNEASRKSRLKHKERDNALGREETELKNRNIDLQKEWEEWKKIENKLKAAVKRQYFQFQSDQ